MAEDGRAIFAARLERRYGAPEDPEEMEGILERVPLEEQFKLASGGEWLSWINHASRRRDNRTAQVNNLEPVAEEPEGEGAQTAPPQLPQGPSGGRGGRHRSYGRRGGRTTYALDRNGNRVEAAGAIGGLAANVQRGGAPRVAMVQAPNPSAPLGPSDAEVELSRLEAGLQLAMELDDAFVQRHGRPHPVFEVPAASLHMLAGCFEEGRKVASA